MITDRYYFSERIDYINELVYNFEKDFIEVTKWKFKRFDETEIKHYYNNTFLTFPFNIETSLDYLAISTSSTEIISCNYEITKNSKKLNQDKIDKILQERAKFNPNEHLELVGDFVEELFHNLIYCYEEFLSNTKKLHFFSNIDDEKIILLNLLKRYKNVVSDETKQIDVFWSVQLPKKISDEIIKMIIDFIEQRLQLLTVTIDQISQEYKVTYVNDNEYKILWNGTQQQLCELFIELENKNWIKQIEYGKRKQFVNAISKIFSLENTKKNAFSDTNNSLYQIFKGENIKNKKTYPFLENKNYAQKFDEIKPNNG